MTKLSTIISVYNGQNFISKTLDSIVNQVILDFECIIIDDGSTDNTKVIINDYVSKYKNISYYYKENGGM